MSFWAGGLLRFPVDRKVTAIKALRNAGLPPVIGARRSDHKSPIVVLTRRQGLGSDRAGVEQMLTGQEMLLLQIRMDWLYHRFVGWRSGRRCDMRDQMRAVLLAGFGGPSIPPRWYCAFCCTAPRDHKEN